MPRPYSVDPRERVPRAHEAGEGSQRVLAARFGIDAGRGPTAGAGPRWAAPT